MTVSEDTEERTDRVSNTHVLSRDFQMFMCVFMYSHFRDKNPFALPHYKDKKLVLTR